VRVLYGSWKEHLSGSGKGENDPIVMPWLFSKPFREQHPERVREMKEQFGKGYLSRKSKAFERQMEANIRHETRGRLNQIQVPTLILVGAHDELTPLRMAEGLRTQIPNAELISFGQGGHGLYWEVPELFNRAVLDFLNVQI
jgi:3-oxoadipate enol-lactonase